MLIIFSLSALPEAVGLPAAGGDGERVLAQKGGGRRVPASRPERWVLLGGSVVLPLPAFCTGISAVALPAPPGHGRGAQSLLSRVLLRCRCQSREGFHLLEEKCQTCFDCILFLASPVIILPSCAS